MKVCSEAVE
uniref:Uncharacterized protein n=1 Tax=Triatoma infestans TaxID=30076 RepID=A0A170UEC2_TRIIF